jgi:hypothetical protein
MGAVEAHSAARVLSTVIAALSGAGVEVLAHTAAQDASQHSAVVGHPTPAHLAQQLYRSAQIRPAAQQPVTPAKAQLMATAAHNMGIVEAQATIAAQDARQALDLAAKLRQVTHHQAHPMRHHQAHPVRHHQAHPVRHHPAR